MVGRDCELQRWRQAVCQAPFERIFEKKRRASETSGARVKGGKKVSKLLVIVQVAFAHITAALSCQPTQGALHRSLLTQCGCSFAHLFHTPHTREWSSRTHPQFVQSPSPPNTQTPPPTYPNANRTQQSAVTDPGRTRAAPRDPARPPRVGPPRKQCPQGPWRSSRWLPLAASPSPRRTISCHPPQTTPMLLSPSLARTLPSSSSAPPPSRSSSRFSRTCRPPPRPWRESTWPSCSSTYCVYRDWRKEVGGGGGEGRTRQPCGCADSRILTHTPYVQFGQRLQQLALLYGVLQPGYVRVCVCSYRCLRQRHKRKPPPTRHRHRHK